MGLISDTVEKENYKKAVKAAQAAVNVPQGLAARGTIAAINPNIGLADTNNGILTQDDIKTYPIGIRG